MIDAIHTLLQNDLFAGGAGMAIIGAVIAYLRHLPVELWRRARAHCFVTLDIMGSEPPFFWLRAWLAQHPYSQRSRSLAVGGEWGAENTGEGSRATFTPAPGEHFLTYRRRLMWITRTRTQSNSMSSREWIETFTVRLFSRDPEIGRQLMADCLRAYSRPADGKIGMFRVGFGEWRPGDRLSPRDPASVILPEHESVEAMVDDIVAFREREQWYRERGIPHRRGYLLEGCPGSGKSSAVLAVASALECDLYALSLAGAYSDDALNALMLGVPARALVVMEDIDAAFVRRERSGKKEDMITFSGLLNALDGIGAREGRVVFLTTNHAEKLDPALIRPGRVDRVFHFGPATTDQARRLHLRFYPERGAEAAEAFAATLMEGETMSSLQGRLIDGGPPRVIAARPVDEPSEAAPDEDEEDEGGQSNRDVQRVRARLGVRRGGFQ